MKTKLILMTSALMLTTGLLLTGTCATATRAGGDDDMRERDEVNQTYKLAPGAEVAVESISGHVKIETADTDTAEVNIIRTARTRADLECRPVRVEQTQTSLRLSGNEQRRQCRNVRMHHRVTLRLPRRISLDVQSVSGHVTAGDLDGPARFTSISGHATVGNVRGPVSFTSISGHVRVTSALDAASFTSISGHVTISLSRLGARGLRAESISGNVELALSSDVNADFRVESISGAVIADDGARITVNKIHDNEFTGRIGAGGAPIEFHSISGNIHLSRAGG